MSAVPSFGQSSVAPRTPRYPAVAGLAVAALAAMVMAGWLLRVPAMVEIFPGAPAMVFANAFSLFLLGGALGLTATRLRGQAAIQTAVGLLALLIGATVLALYGFGIDSPLDLPAVHGWLRHPGRMAPNTALAHMLAGAALVLMSRARGERWAVAALFTAFVVLMMGVTGLATYRLHPELLYGWHVDIRMAIHTGLAFVALGTGIAAATYHAHRLSGYFRQHEALRIGLLAGGLLTFVALAAGLAAFSLLQDRIDSTLRDGLTLAFKNRVEFLNSEIHHGLTAAERLASRPGIQRELLRLRAQPGDRAALRALSEAVGSFVRAESTGIRLRDAAGRVVVEVGEQRAPQLAVPLALAEDARLLWDGASLGIDARVPITRDRAVLGSIEIVQALPALTRMLFDVEALGATGEMPLCGRTARGIECFPTAREPQPYLLAESTPHGPAVMTEALAQRHGTGIVVDRLGHRVMAAYGPASGLGAVLKIDVAEIYGPVRRRFELVGLVLAVVIAASLLLLHSRLLPVVRRLVRSEAQFRGLVDSAPDAMVVSDESGRIILVNAQAEALFGYRRAELLGRPVEMLLPERFRAAHGEQRLAYAGAPRRRPMGGGQEFYALRKDGSEIPVEIGLSPLETEHGTVVVSTVRDVSERLRQVEALRASEQRWQFALEGAGDGLWDWNLVTNEVFFSRQWKRMLGYDEGDVAASLDEWDRRVHPDDKPGAYADIQRHVRGETPMYQNEHRLRCKDGSYRWILDRGLIVSRDADGKPLRMIGTHTDITERKRAEQTIRELSLIDELTGLRNRRGFVTIADAELRLAQRTGQRLSLFFADLDGMKQINDRYGHTEGDRALRDVAQILQETFRDADVIAHLGGDEFVVLALAVDPTDEAKTFARLEERIDRHNREAGRRYRIAVSVGVARHDPASTETLEELLARADAEMYRVKLQRRAARQDVRETPGSTGGLAEV